MARQYKNGKCSCWKRIDKALAEHDTALDEAWSLDGKRYLQIATVRTDGRRKPSKRVMATHCPFCGGELKKD